MKILVVEDEKDMNHIIKKELESEGYLVDASSRLRFRSYRRGFVQ